MREACVEAALLYGLARPGADQVHRSAKVLKAGCPGPLHLAHGPGTDAAWEAAGRQSSLEVPVIRRETAGLGAECHGVGGRAQAMWCQALQPAHVGVCWAGGSTQPVWSTRHPMPIIPGRGHLRPRPSSRTYGASRALSGLRPMGCLEGAGLQMFLLPLDLQQPSDPPDLAGASVPLVPVFGAGTRVLGCGDS